MSNGGTKKSSGNEARLETRIAELERKLSELSEQTMALEAHVREHEVRLEARVQKIADLIATSQAGRI